ncbi:hypothetical protein EHO51_18195 (plasmid) [Methylocystis rosea]|uniref:Uncharacterized protein n=1 Tax=Methylocystis rosea TaxID=173366 RepID=A0A3G8MA59_9HYPH|nr:hypothetical protein EHO51_18195 [Methylocystis rosea]
MAFLLGGGRADRGLTAIPKPRADRAASKGPKRSAGREAPTFLAREECPARNAPGREKSRRLALRQAGRLWRHRCSQRPSRGPLAKSRR